MKLQENKKPNAENLGQQTWTQIQDVATGEKKANGKMLFICRDTFKMHKAGKLNWATYFDKGTNDVDYKNAFINGDGTKRTLIAKDFHIFATQVLIPAYGQNLTNFQKDHPYEWWVILQVSPVIMLMIANEQYFKADEMLNMETDPVQLELPKKMLAFKDLAVKDEQIFRSNLGDKFFTKDEKGKDFYCTFRGERGAVEFAKAYFTPKKIAIENVQNAVQSPFMKAVQKLNDVQTGVIGTANTLTNVAKSEQNKGGNMDKRLIMKLIRLLIQQKNSLICFTIIITHTPKRNCLDFMLILLIVWKMIIFSSIFLGLVKPRSASKKYRSTKSPLILSRVTSINT